MGREVKRVPLDFDWPVGQTWLGYAVEVKFPPCPDCLRSGYSAQARDTRDRLTSGAQPWPGSVDRWDSWHAVAVLADTDGFAVECERCGGHGDLATQELRDWAEAMPETPVPTGGGWQLWETVGDSPMSPVFATDVELVEWMTNNPWMLNPSLTGPSRVASSRELAERFVAVGSSIGSFVVRDGQLIDGVTAAVQVAP